MRYQHVLRAVRDTPWAIRPESLLIIQDVIAQRVHGEHLTDQEIQARIQAARPLSPASQHGDVAVLPLFGVLMPRASLMSQMSGGTSVEQFTRDLADLVADDTVDTIVLNVDSPGGMTDLIPEAAQQIREARNQKRIVAVANTDAASAAYWLAAQATELVVTPSGSVGSVGVYAAHQDFSEKLQREGVTTTLISAGRFKTEGNPFEPLNEEALAALQGRVDEFYSMFVADVAAGRRVTTDDVRAGFGEGRMVTANHAVAAGMADRVDTLDGVVARLTGRTTMGRRRPGRATAASGGHHQHDDSPEAATSGLSLADGAASAAPTQVVLEATPTTDRSADVLRERARYELGRAGLRHQEHTGA